MGRQSFSTVVKKVSIVVGETPPLSTLTHISNSLKFSRALF